MERIGPSDHLAIFGMTGTGKTYLARSLLRAVPRRVVLDPKHMYHDDAARVVREYDHKHPYQIYRAGDDIDAYDHYLRAVWDDGRPTVIYVDEVADLARSTRVLSRQLSRAIREGRQRHIRVWSASQRPADIPSVVFTEASHIYCFYLSYEGDRRKVERFTGDGIAEGVANLRGHEYYYWSVRGRVPRYHAPLARRGAVAVGRITRLPRRSLWRGLREALSDA